MSPSHRPAPTPSTRKHTLALKNRSAPSETTTWALVALECALALALMLYALGGPSLWFDEAVSAHVSDLGLRSLVFRLVRREPNFGLYYGLLRGWSVFGHSEAALRSLSVVFGVATVPVLFALTARLFSTRAGLIAGLLTAVNATVVAQAQHARPYALVMFLVSLATLCFVRALEARDRLWWVVYALVAALAVYAQPVAIFVLVAHLLSLLFLRRRDIDLRRALPGAIVFGALVLPLGGLVLASGSDRIDWISPTSFDEFRNVLEQSAGGTLGLFVLGLVACLLTVIAGTRALSQRGRGPEAWRYELIVMWFVVPIVAVVLVSVVRPLFVDRYLLVSLPAFVVATAVGIASIRIRWLSVAFLIVLVAISGAVLVRWLTSESATATTALPRQDWRSLTSYVRSHAKPGDGIVFEPAGLDLGYRYYDERLGSPRTVPAFTPFAYFAAPLGRNEVATLADRYDRLWFVTIPSQYRPGVRPAISLQYSKVRRRSFMGPLEVELYERTP